MNLKDLNEKATPGPWGADPKRLIIQTPTGDREGPVMSYLVGNPGTGPGMTVSIASERHADHHFVAALVNAYRAGDLVDRAELDHWKRMHECAQNANAFRQAALDKLA